jgi:hypothetical protein
MFLPRHGYNDPIRPAYSTRTELCWIASFIAVTIVVLILQLAATRMSVRPTDVDRLDERSATPSPVKFEMTARKELEPLQISTNRIDTVAIMIVPSPVQWEDRRERVHAQFAREGWTQSQTVLLFVFGNDTHDKLVPVSYPNATNVMVSCRDYGDALDNTDDISATTCKIYQAIRYIVSHYTARYVWRGADNSYVNLRYFSPRLMHSLPSSRLYFGRLRTANDVQDGQASQGWVLCSGCTSLAST